MKINGRYIPGGEIVGPTVAIDMGKSLDVMLIPGADGFKYHEAEAQHEIFMPAGHFLKSHDPKTQKPLVSAEEIAQLGLAAAVQLGFKRLNESTDENIQ